MPEQKRQPEGPDGMEPMEARPPALPEAASDGEHATPATGSQAESGCEADVGRAQAVEDEPAPVSFADMHRDLGRDIRTAEDELRRQGRLSGRHWTDAARRANPFAAAAERVRVILGRSDGGAPSFKMGGRDDLPTLRAHIAIALLATIVALQFPLALDGIADFQERLTPEPTAKAERRGAPRLAPAAESKPAKEPSLPNRPDPFVLLPGQSGEPAPPPRSLPGVDAPPEGVTSDTGNSDVRIVVPDVPPVTASTASAPAAKPAEPKEEETPAQKLQFVGIMVYGSSDLALLEQEGVVVYARRGDRVLGGTYRVAEINGDHVKLDQGAGRNEVVLALAPAHK